MDNDAARPDGFETEGILDEIDGDERQVGLVAVVGRIAEEPPVGSTGTKTRPDTVLSRRSSSPPSRRLVIAA